MESLTCPCNIFHFPYALALVRCKYLREVLTYFTFYEFWSVYFFGQTAHTFTHTDKKKKRQSVFCSVGHFLPTINKQRHIFDNVYK